ncbi:MAG: autophagocytosis associated protein [Linnemannia elongata]|nr:MAG: autophagocytosis associated protein [Linnemannia elongata]
MTSETHRHQQSGPSARLSYSDFEVAIKAFLHQTRFHTPWSYVEYSPRRGQPLQGYLTLTKLVHSHHTGSGVPSTSSGTLSTGTRITTIDPADQLLLDELAEQLDEIPDGDDYEEEELDPVVENSTSTTTFDYLSVNYHIVFSPSYQVPVLYFNAFRPDGAAISLEEIYESLVPEEWRGAIRNAGLNGGVSQQDHPVLNTPYYYMHPCETVPLMETILQNNDSPNGTSFLESYIVTWLSFTGQAIGVSVPTDMVAANGQ